MDDVTGRERRLADYVSRAEKTAKQLRSELTSERNYSSRVRQEREEAKNKVTAVLKETAAARAAGEKTQEELNELRTSLEKKQQENGGAGGPCHGSHKNKEQRTLLS